MSNTAKRIIAFVLGSLVGLAYGLSSEFVNVLALPGVPLFEAPPGRLAMILLSTLGCGLIGLVSVLPADGVFGMIFGALLTASFSTGLVVWVERGGAEKMFSLSTILFLTFLPRMVMFTPLAGGFRYLIHLWDQETTYNPLSLRARLLSPLITIVLAVGLGVFSLHSQTARAALTDLHALTEQSLQATQLADIPLGLQDVDGLRSANHGAYVMNLIKDPDVIPVQRPMTDLNTYVPAIIVVFEDGFRFGCVYTPPYERPYCQDF